MKKIIPLLLCSMLASCSTYWEANSSTNESGVTANVVYTRQQYTHKEKLRVFVTDRNGNKIATHEIKEAKHFEVDQHFKGDVLKVKLVDKQDRVLRVVKVDIHKGEL